MNLVCEYQPPWEIEHSAKAQRSCVRHRTATRPTDEFVSRYQASRTARMSRGRSTSPRPLDIDEDMNNDTAPENPNAKVVIVTNLTKSVFETHLQTIFGFYGEIVKVDLPLYATCEFFSLLIMTQSWVLIRLFQWRSWSKSRKGSARICRRSSSPQGSCIYEWRTARRRYRECRGFRPAHTDDPPEIAPAPASTKWPPSLPFCLAHAAAAASAWRRGRRLRRKRLVPRSSSSVRYRSSWSSRARHLPPAFTFAHPLALSIALQTRRTPPA